MTTKATTNLTDAEKENFIREAKERVKKHNIHAVDTDQIRREVLAIAEERRASGTGEAFSSRMGETYPYLKKHVPLLFKEATEGADVTDTIQRSEEILGIIERARRLNQTPLDCAMAAERTIMARRQ
jgi:hypothetical protein